MTLGVVSDEPIGPVGYHPCLFTGFDVYRLSEVYFRRLNHD